MEEEKDIRWKQRFMNFEKAYMQLVRFVEKGELNEFEEQGFIKCFEYTYELAWNVMKDFLNYQGITGIIGSRDAIRQAFNKELIEDGESWMKMVDDRIKSAHTYDEQTAESVEENINHVYFGLFTNFYEKMKNQS